MPLYQARAQLKGASKGLLVNSSNICQKTYRATVKFTAHNGLAYTDHPPLKAKCKAKGAKAKAKPAGRRVAGDAQCPPPKSTAAELAPALW